jgi:nucleoid-associated protein YgaU
MVTVGGIYVTVSEHRHERHGSLWNIAEDVYGDGSLWTAILEANGEELGDDALFLRPGQRLYVPEISRPLAHAKT